MANLRFWSAVAVVASVAVLSAADGIRITPLVREDKVLISCELANGFTEDVRAAIASGLRTTFSYNVDLKVEVPIWIDRTIDSAVVTNSVQYDNLTRRHSLLRMVDGRVEDALVTEDETIVRTWMTTLERLPLFKTSLLEPNRDYYVQISVRARPQGAALLAWAAISGQAKFTFIR
jgi:hypothetical protein